MPDQSKHTANSARCLNNGGILLEMDTEEASQWLNSAKNCLTFLASLAPEARIKARTFPIVIQFVPLHFGPDRSEEMRHVEETNKMSPGSIMSTHWLKPTQCRDPKQTCAHTLITFHSTEVANRVLMEGIIICQEQVYAQRCKKEPIRCLRCHGWNHLTYTCPQKYDTCRTCGDRHKTSTCSNKTKHHCVSCNTNDHASLDRDCPTFTCKCANMDSRLTENTMPYFPTDEPWTHITQPAKIILTSHTPMGPPNDTWQRAGKHKGRYRQMTLPYNPMTHTINDHNLPPSDLAESQHSPASNVNAISLGPNPHWSNAENATLPTLGRPQ